MAGHHIVCTAGKATRHGEGIFGGPRRIACDIPISVLEGRDRLGARSTDFSLEARWAEYRQSLNEASTGSGKYASSGSTEVSAGTDGTKASSGREIAEPSANARWVTTSVRSIRPKHDGIVTYRRGYLKGGVPPFHASRSDEVVQAHSITVKLNCNDFFDIIHLAQLR